MLSAAAAFFSKSPGGLFFFVKLVVADRVRTGKYRSRRLAGRTGHRISVLVDLHAETQAHLRENLLDLV
jgi:cation transport ATPase